MKIEYTPNQWATIIDENDTHILIEFESGTKICTSKSRFDHRAATERIEIFKSQGRLFDAN